MTAPALPVAGYQGITPPDRIALGAFLCFIVVGLPLGVPLLVSGLRQLRAPLWRMRTFTKWAARDPRQAEELIGRAAELIPGSPELESSLATLYFNRGDCLAALPHLRVWAAQSHDDVRVLGALASAALECGDVGEAIDVLHTVRAEPRLSPDARAMATAHLAYAHLCDGDPQQAFTVLGAVTADEGPGMQECLFYRAIAKYFLGYAPLAIADLDRLRRVNAAYAGLDATRDAMTARTYQLLLPDGTAYVPVPQERGGDITVQRLPAGPHCGTCGARTGDDDVICRYCGTLLVTPDTENRRAQSEALS